MLKRERDISRQFVHQLHFDCVEESNFRRVQRQHSCDLPVDKKGQHYEGSEAASAETMGEIAMAKSLFEIRPSAPLLRARPAACIMQCITEFRGAVMKMLSVRLDDKEAAALKALCDETGLSRSQAVKRGLSALASSARRGKTPGVLAEELGIVGCFSGPRDLSVRVGHYVKKSLRAKSAR